MLAPVTWVVAFVVTAVTTGLPLGHAALFFWIVLGLAAFSLNAWRSWGRLLLEWIPLLALLVAYDWLRGAASVPEAEAHSSLQIKVDRWLGGGELPTVWLQRHLYHPGHLPWYDIAVWCVYLTHFFAVWVVAAVLWKVAHDRFGRYVSLIVLVTLMAFATYWLYPAQPPWLSSHPARSRSSIASCPRSGTTSACRVVADLFDTGSGLVNMVAAMPSLHAAYPLTLLLFFWNDGKWWRILLGAYTLAMGFTLVYGGEHYVVDILVGWLYAGVAYGAVCVAWPAWRVRLRASEIRDAVPAAETR